MARYENQREMGKKAIARMLSPWMMPESIEAVKADEETKVMIKITKALTHNRIGMMRFNRLDSNKK